MTPPWQELSNCQTVNPDLFFPANKWQEREAKLVCAGCVVKRHCYEFALTSNKGQREQIGIWGGRNFEKRREVFPRAVSA